MRTIIAGSREGPTRKHLEIALKDCGFVPSVVLCGEARGGDTIGKEWAIENNIPIESFPADWDKYGRSAGFIRNQQMVENAEALIALWDGKSKGTRHTIELANEKGLQVHVYII